jgi:hypothetical protein
MFISVRNLDTNDDVPSKVFDPVIYYSDMVPF